MQILFGIPTAQIAPRLKALQAALVVTQAEALLLVQDAPELLLKPSNTLKQAWEELQQAARKRPEWREQIGSWAASSLNKYALIVARSAFKLLARAHGV